MKHLILVGVLAATSILAACQDPAPQNDDVLADAAEATVVAPAAEDAGVPASAPSAVDAPPVDPSALPPEKRSSEETVQPESETLFY